MTVIYTAIKAVKSNAKQWLLLLPLLGAFTSRAAAQIPAIAPSADGTGTQINSNGNNIHISGGSLSTDGANLFHSFQRFGLSEGQIANFLSNPNIRNILGRVTGGDASIINGLIQVTGGNSNLFLMNPAGIVFGPNARLDVPGSFLATTATGIGFGSNWFHAAGENNYAALVGTPSAFVFSPSELGAIVNFGDLAVADGNNLILASGTVLNTGGLRAPGGHLSVTAVPGSSLVRISQTGHLLSLELETSQVPTFAASNLPSFQPASLPALLAGGGVESATGVQVNSDGSVQLVGSGRRVEAGDVAIAAPEPPISQTLIIGSASGTTPASDTIASTGDSAPTGTSGSGTATPPLSQLQAGAVTLSASRNIALVNSHLEATDGAQLRAAGEVSVRDSWINAGGELYIQGDRGVSFTPQSALYVIKGGAIALVSGGEISADAVFQSNGDFSILNLTGQPANFNSQQYLTIKASGNVTFGNYTGGSLDVKAQGNISAGDITLTSPKGTPSILTLNAGWNSTPASSNGNLKVGNTTLGFSGGTVKLSAIGNLQTGSIITDGAEIGLFSTSSLDVSSGKIEGRYITLSANANIATGDIESSSSINIYSGQGAIDTRAGTLEIISTTGFSGSISLRAQSDIKTGDIKATAALIEILNGAVGVLSPPKNGGSIIIKSREGSIDTSAGVLDVSSQRGDAGTITLTAKGNISTGNLSATSISGTGGNIILYTTGGALDTSAATIDTSSQTGKGGNITLYSTSGSIAAGILNAASLEGSGGNISLSAGEEIRTGDIFGKDISLISQGAINTSAGSVNSGGNINFHAAADVATAGVNSAGGNVEITSRGGSINTSAGLVEGERSQIVLHAAGSVTTGEIRSNGGDISITSSREAIAATAGAIDSSSQEANGGKIYLEANRDIFAGEIDSHSDVTTGGDVVILSRNGADSSSTVDNPLASLPNIEIGSINARGGSSGTGGNVRIESPNLVRITGAIADSNGTSNSISSAGGLGSGAIAIYHQLDSATPIPFTVGSAAANGTAFAIATGEDAILPMQTFDNDFTLGNISIIVSGAGVPPRNAPPLPDSPSAIAPAVSIYENTQPLPALPEAVLAILPPPQIIPPLPAPNSAPISPPVPVPASSPVPQPLPDSVLAPLPETIQQPSPVSVFSSEAPAPTPTPAPLPASAPASELPSATLTSIPVPTPAPLPLPEPTSVSKLPSAASAPLPEPKLPPPAPLPPPPPLPEPNRLAPVPATPTSNLEVAPLQPRATSETGNAPIFSPPSPPKTEFPGAIAYTNLTNPDRAQSHAEPFSLTAGEVQTCWAEVQQGGVLRDYTKAIGCFQQNLLAAREVKNLQWEVRALNNLGVAYFQVGDYGKALDSHSRQLAIARALENPLEQGQALVGLASVYSAIGNPERAIDYYQQSLEIAGNVKTPYWQGTALRNLGIAYLNLENYDKAIEYQQQSLTLAKEQADKRGEAQALGNLGIAYFSLGNYARAIEFGEQHLAAMRSLGEKRGEAQALGNLGLAYHALQDYQKAIEYHQQHLAIARSSGDRPSESHALKNLGEALLKSDRQAEAEIALRAGVEIVESIRADVGSDDLNKVSLFDTQTNIYGALQEALVAQNKFSEALEIAERGRARAFVELLAKRAGSQSPAAMSESLSAPNIDKIKQIAKEQNSTLVAYSIITNPFDIEGRRYNLESDIYIWVVQPSGSLDFRRVDFTSKRATSKGLELKKLVAFVRESIGVRGRGLGVVPRVEGIKPSQNLQELYQLLIEPIASLLPENPNDRVIFIPQGELFLVPFAALQDASGKYLIEKQAILTAPSIQAIELTRQQRLRSARDGEAIVVGNPAMPSVSPELGQPPQPLPSLPGAEREALFIAQLFHTTALTGASATKQAILQQLPKARIIHLATHGLLEDVASGIPGAIALAPSDADSGLLSAEEILNLKLNAELVVLSACDTGRGRITGDGVIGLSRSFISAGVSSVLVSLWAVPDAPTAELMAEFYRQLQRTSDKAIALRNAMLATMQQHPDPKDWAAFTLIGEAR